MGEVLNELFEILSKDLHFNATKLNSETYEQNWKVPEGFISIIGLENAKMPVFYYGITNSYKKEFEIKSGDSINIPIENEHRVKCLSDEPLIFIEVQTGTYFGEDDIIRLEDDFGR